MNTKGIKFLAVLAVMMMAFAAVIVLAPADRNADAITFTADQVDPKILDATQQVPTLSAYYISDDATVKIKNLTTDVTFYVQNGKELILDIRGEIADGISITVMTVTSDLEAHTTSTVDIYVWEGQVTGKTYLPSTGVEFEPVKGQTFVYNALVPKVTTTYNETDGSIKANIAVEDKYSTISSDEPLVKAVIESQVTIADNLFVTTKDTNFAGVEDMYYGVLYYDADEGVYTIYAPGMNAGTISLNKASDEVLIADGSATVKTTKASVKASNVYNAGYDDLMVTYATGEKLTVSNDLGIGAVIVDGEITLDDFTIYSYGTLTAATSTKFQGTSKVTVEGELITKVAADELKKLDVVDPADAEPGKVIVENKKAWTYTNRVPSIIFKDATPAGDVFNNKFTGLIDVSAITESADVVNRFSTAEIAPDQTFIVVGNTTVTSSILVKGVLIINEGVTVTISKIKTKENYVGAALTLDGQYGQIINNGTILIETAAGTSSSDDVGLHIHGGYAVNNNEIRTKSDKDSGLTFDVDFTKTKGDKARGLGFVNYGNITVSKTDTVYFTDRFVNAGNLTIGGAFAGTEVEFNNAGYIAVNGAVIDKNLTVNMLLPGAEFTITSAKITGEPSITVTNGQYGGTVTVKGVNDAQIRGLTVVDVLKLVPYTQKLDVSGSVSVNGAKDLTLAMTGNIDVSSSFTVGNGYNVDLKGANLNVTGVMTLSDKVEDKTSGTWSMAATGSVICLSGVPFSNYCSYSGAMYAGIPTPVVYTNFADAVLGAIEADVDLVTIGSKGATVDTPLLTIPAGMNITGGKLTVGSTSSIATVLGIQEGVSMSLGQNGVIVKNGCVKVANSYDLDADDVKADVEVVDEDDNSAVYANLEYALVVAEAGDVIELSETFMMTSGTLVIPEGVTVDATASEDAKTDFVLINSDLIVNGVLMVDKFQFIATTDDTKSITVGDHIMEYNEDGYYLEDHWYTPIGVSYKWTIVDENEDEHTWFVITNIAHLQDAINVADEAKVTVEGSPKLGDLTITGREDMPAEVTFNGNINAGTLTLDDVTIIAKPNNQINATFANALGSITIIGAYVDKQVTITSLDEEPVTMSGSLKDATDGTYLIRFDGITAMEDATIGWGYDQEDFPTILFNGTTTASGKKDQMVNLVAIERTTDNAGIVTITGSLIADNGTRVTIDADVEVLGSLIAKPMGEKNPGSVEVNGDIFVGALKSDLYDVDGAIAATSEDAAYKDYGKKDNGYGKTVLSATAVLDGKIILGEKIAAGTVHPAKDCFITAVDGASIDDQIIEDLSSMDITIEDSVWVTVYGATTAKYSMDGLRAPIVNAKVDTITDASGKDVAKFSHIYKVIYGCGEDTLSSYGYVYISLNYYAFTVTIKTDGSVKAVYIDGILMYTGENRNTFELFNVATGTHKVTVEPSAGYAADGCKLYTDMGTILPGMAFTFTEYDCVYEDGVNTYNVIYNINGTEIEPEPVPPTPEEESQWTVTTILLVILVVLIAIMAVIVALRLNRS